MNYKKIFTNREMRLRLIHALRFIPTKPYIKMVYRIKTGRKLNLENPVGFNEKLNWLKLHDIHPEYVQLADKVTVRDYIKEHLGEEYLFPLLGIWDSFDDIDFDTLPDRFVLKCTHDSGSFKIIRNKAEINKEELRKFFKSRLKMSSYYIGREYSYKGIPPRIIAEKLMCTPDGELPRDYKFFCFNGEPFIMMVIKDRDTDITLNLFDMDFKPLDIDYVHKSTKDYIQKPAHFEEMKELARKLSQGMKIVRIDLYELDDRIYFGEFTFCPAGGFYLFHPDEWEKKMGDMIDLNS